MADSSGEANTIVGHVTGINIFPIKSCRGVALEKADISYSGLYIPGQERIKDRHFTLVNPSGSVIHQRANPCMARIVSSIEDGGLELSAPDMDNLRVVVPDDMEQSQLKQCDVWTEPIGGADCGDEVADWFTRYLKKPARLVYAVSGQNRRREKERGNVQDKIAYQDDMPFMMLGEASVTDLNTKLEDKVTTRNFRPNIVVDTKVPYQEDQLKEVKIGSAAKFTNIRRCVRCLMTTIDPISGIQSPKGEPLKTLRQYRVFPEADAKSPCMGTFLVMDSAGTISVGDPVYASMRS